MGHGARTFSGGINISKALASALMMSTAIVAGGIMTNRDAYAQNAAQTSFNVPAGPLNRALTAFGRQAGLQVDRRVGQAGRRGSCLYPVRRSRPLVPDPPLVVDRVLGQFHRQLPGEA